MWLNRMKTDVSMNCVVAWRFPEELPFNKRIVKVGPEAERGVPCG